MYHFFVESSEISDSEVRITGSDYNHLKNVIRLKNGDKVMISVRGEDGKGNMMCQVDSFTDDAAVLLILDEEAPQTELPCEVTIYQGLPKSDKMELIIQKCVELGATRIVPVSMKHCIMKLDDKKADSKISRWNAISEAAAKQSKRSVIPTVDSLMSYKEALNEAVTGDLVLVPYENEEGMSATRRLIGGIKAGQRVSVFIGPEGGFDTKEIELAKEMGANPVTLGKRILRTETAAMATLSMIAYQIED